MERGVALWVALLLLCTPTAHGESFLEEQLPLKVLVTTPTVLLSDSSAPVTLTGRQAITAVFSRPVIALGSDFGQDALPADLVPFSLSCGTPGRLRWVTTNIARFDPSVDWPTDLDCSLTWNQGLKTYDGAPLILSSPKSFRLTTGPVTMSLQSVSSAAANNATDNQWDARAGALPGDKLPEVPPDGNITLSFSYPVDLSKLQSSLKVVTPGASSASKYTVSISPCVTTYYRIFWLASTTRTTDANSLKQNATCAVVRISPALAPQQEAALQLPVGARYNALAGTVKSAQEVKVFGLRAFRIPLSPDFTKLSSLSDPLYSGVRYRRLTMWLPHGLATGTKISDLQKQISICVYKDPVDASSPCSALRFSLRRPTKGTLVMSVPELRPKLQYQVTVTANSQIQDAMGLPLQASSNRWWTYDYDGAFEGPSFDTSYGSARVAVMEVAAEKLTWPFVSRGNSNTLKSASYWPLDVRGKYLAAALQATAMYATPADAFGPAAASVTRSNSTAPSFTSLTLPGGPGITAVATCCSQNYNNGVPNDVYATSVLVVASNLQAVFVSANDQSATAWVTTTQGSSKGVASAVVQLYVTSYSYSSGQSSSTTSKVSSCTTGANGSCDLKYNDLTTRFANMGYSLSAVVTAAGEGPLVIPAIPSPGSSMAAAQYQGILVLDRKLIKQGDKLHVTGYLQKQSGSVMSLPKGLSTATLRISPNFDPNSATPLSVTANIDPVYGSVHETINVPATAKAQPYSISLLVPSSNQGATAKQPSATAPGLAPNVVSPSIPPPDGGNMVSVSNVGFTVADPRPPTAELAVTVPAWVKPAAKIPINLQAVSYIGADVSNADVTLTWTTPKASGSLNATTNSKGNATATIDLGALPAENATAAGDSLSLTAVWIGPTRERIVVMKTIRIAEGPIRVEMSRTLDTDLPGVPFGVSATAFNNEDDSAQNGIQVSISLTLKNTSKATNCTSASNTKCTLTTGVANPGACQLALPCMGDYILKACVVSGSSCSEVPMGRNATSWSNNPWSSHPSLTMLPTKANYSLGSTVDLAIQNPFWGPTSGWVVWGNAIKTIQKFVSEVPQGPSTISLGTIGEECKGGCKAIFTMAVARPSGSSSKAALPPVPVSLLFDPLAPHTEQATADISVVGGDNLKVSISVKSGSSASSGKAVVAPGANATITVAVADAGGAAAANAEVTLIAVDKAILDLIPYPLQNISSDLRPYLTTYFNTRNINTLRTQRSAINATFAALRRRLGIDPWLPIETRVQPPGPYTPFRGGGITPNPSSVDIPDDKYLSQYTTAITPLPVTFCAFGNCPVPVPEMVMNAFVLPKRSSIQAVAALPAAAPMASAAQTLGDNASGAGGAANARPSTGGDLRIQSDFETTPLFMVYKATADGTATASFKAPPNLGSFVLRAYVASVGSDSAASKYGSAESTLLVRKTVSLTPSVPRIVRVGDKFEAGVLVTAPDISSDISVTVGAGVIGPNARTPLLLVGGSPSKSTITLTANNQQQEVRFQFSAASVGNATLRFSATVGGATAAVADSVQLVIPVLGVQSDVWVATSFAIRPNASNGAVASRQEGLLLPKAVNGSGSLDLVAGVGYLPAVKTTYDQLVSQYYQDTWNVPNGQLSIGLSVMPVILSLYQPSKPYSSWLSSKQLAASVASMSDAVNKLTDPQFGLLYFDPNKGFAYRPDRCDITLNAWASWLVTGLTAPKSEKNYSPRWDKLLAASNTWQTALGKQITEDATDARTKANVSYADLDTLSWVRLALGADWTPTTASDAVKQDLSMSRLTKAVANLTMGSQTRVALTLLQKPSTSSTDQQLVDGVISRLISNIRVGGRTAYVATDPGSAHAAGLQDQSLALVLFVKAGTAAAAGQQVLVQKVASYIAQGPPTSRFAPLSINVGAFDGALLARALSVYDDASNSTLPNLTLNTTAGSRVLLTATYTPQNAGQIFNSSTPWSQVPPASRLAFVSRGKGEVSVAASLHFVPADLMYFPTYRGLWVQRVVQLDSKAGGNVTAAPLAKAVTVVVQVTTPDDMSGVTVEVMMPGGLEPLDPNVYPDKDAQSICRQSSDESDITQPSPDVPVGLPMPMPMPVDFPGAVPRPVISVRPTIVSGPSSSSLPAVYSGSWWRPWPMCPAQETLPAMVKLSYAFMPAGTHTVQLKAIAATAGVFVLPPVKAYVDKQPEIMGLSPAGSFKVCATQDCPEAKQGAVAAAPKSCSPVDCSGNGVCNLGTGVCICDDGFTGTACDQFKGRAGTQ